MLKTNFIYHMWSNRKLTTTKIKTN